MTASTLVRKVRSKPIFEPSLVAESVIEAKERLSNQIPDMRRTSPPTRSAENRLELLDSWRIISAIAIVWLHTPQSELFRNTTTFARYAVPFFAATSGFMACRIQAGPFKESIPAFLKSRFNRIYAPFLIWSLVYLAIRYAVSLLVPSTRAYPITTELLWRGPAAHLWFLPFIFVATVFSHFIGRAVSYRPSLTWLLAGSLLVVSAATLMNPEVSPQLAYTLHLSYNTLPALCWGIFLAIVCGSFGKSWLSNRSVAAAAFAAFVSLVLALVVGGRNIFIENLAGLFLLLSCFAVKDSPWIVRVALLGPLAYGTYLSHMLFVEGFQDVAQLARLPVSPANDLAVFMLSVVAALTLTILLEKRQWVTSLLSKPQPTPSAITLAR